MQQEKNRFSFDRLPSLSRSEGIVKDNVSVFPGMPITNPAVVEKRIQNIA